MGRCPDCGKMNKDQAKCCTFCGSKLAKTGTKSSAYAYLIGVILLFVGFIPLGLGVSTIYGAISTEQMYKGTILEDDPDAQTIISNTKGQGTTEVVIGSIAVIIGILVMLYPRWSVFVQDITPSTGNKPTGKTHLSEKRRMQKKKGLLDINPLDLFLDVNPRPKTTKGSSGIAAKRKANMFCRGCGSQLKADSKFCPSCGLEVL